MHHQNSSPLPTNRPISLWYRWELMLLVWCTYFLHQIDRAIFGVPTKNIKNDLGLNDFQIGLSHQLLFFVIAAMVPVAGFVGTSIAASLGWRSVFYIFGGLGILMGIILLFRLREPPEENNTQIQPSSEATPETVIFWEAVWHIVRIPTVLLLTVRFTAVVFVNNAYFAFAPLLH